MSEISRLYRVVKSGASALKERAAESSANIQVAGGTDPGDEVYEEVGGSSDGTGQVP